MDRWEILSHVLVFLLALVLGLVLAYPIAESTAHDQLSLDKSIFGEGTVTAHGYWFPEFGPGSTTYTKVRSTSVWLGDGSYRVLIRSSPMICEEKLDVNPPGIIPSENIAAALSNESDEYVYLSEEWTIVMDDIPPLTEFNEIYFRMESPSPLPAGEYHGTWQVKLDAAIDLDEYASARAWQVHNLLPWFLGIFSFVFTAGNWTVRQIFKGSRE